MIVVNGGHGAVHSMNRQGSVAPEPVRLCRLRIAWIDWSSIMATFRFLVLAAAAAHTLTACAQNPTPPGNGDRAARQPPNAAVATDRMAMMEAHMKAMCEMREKMSRAGTPEERQALMAEHMKLMHEGMAKMGGMGMGMGMGMGGMRGAAPAGAASAPTDIAARQDMLEKRIDMMQSMMQLMLDRMTPPPRQP